MDFKKERKKLIDKLRVQGYLSDETVIQAFLRVKRENFIPENKKKSAYLDQPLPIGKGQTISAPHMVAIMTEKLDLKPNHKVLEIGTGSGYQAAILSEIVKEGKVYSLEKVSSLAKKARRKLKNYANVKVIQTDGTLGHKRDAPYDRIIVTAAAPHIPNPLKEQLAESGKLLIPVGGKLGQNLIRLEKRKDGFTEENLGGCVFVPLVGENGWKN